MTLYEKLAVFLGSAPDRPLETKQLIVVHLNIILYALCFWLCQPVLPFLMKQLGADPVTMGLLDTTFSVVQLAGGPIMGRLCDVKGARTTIVLAQAAGAVAYFLQGISVNLPLLFASKIPSLLQHCMIGAQAGVTILALPSIRALAMGRLSLSYGIGMIVGSSLGGVLAEKFGHFFVAVLASGLSFAAVPLSYAWLPSSASATPVAEPTRKESGGPPTSAKSMLHLLSNQSIVANLTLRFLVGLGLSVQRATFKFVGPALFGIGAADMGYVMSYSAVLSLFSNVFVVGWATWAAGSDERAMQGAIAVLTASFVAYASISTLPQMLVVFFPQVAAASCLYTVAASVITKCVDATDTGAAIGLSHGVTTLTGVIAPTVGGYLYSEHGHHWLGLFCSACCAVAFVFSFVGLRIHPNKAIHKKTE